MKNEFNLMVGQRIRNQREYLGYTREKLAEKLDISTTFLTDVEAGGKGISITTLVKLCNVLHLTADYILFGREEYTDNTPIIEAFKTVDEKHIGDAEELLKVFIKALDA